MTDDICGICGKPILDGEAVYGLPDKEDKYRHYDCWEREHSPRALRELEGKLEDAIVRMKKLLEKMS